MDRENYIIPFEPPAADATHPLAEQLSEETQNDTPAEDTPAQETYEDIPAPLQRHAVKQYAGAVLCNLLSQQRPGSTNCICSGLKERAGS